MDKIDGSLYTYHPKQLIMEFLTHVLLTHGSEVEWDDMVELKESLYGGGRIIGALCSNMREFGFIEREHVDSSIHYITEKALEEMKKWTSEN